MRDNSGFDESCYTLLKLVPEGKVTTYKEMANALNSRAWRAVGRAMAKNKHLFVIPCHRVVRSDGAIGGYALGSDKKAALLTAEGITVENGKVKNLGACLHRF